MFFEKSAEIRYTFKTKLCRYFTYGIVGVFNQHYGTAYKQTVAVFHRCFSGHLFKKLIKPRRTEKTKLRKLFAIDITGGIFTYILKCRSYSVLGGIALGLLKRAEDCAYFFGFFNGVVARHKV